MADMQDNPAVADADDTLPMQRFARERALQLLYQFDMSQQDDEPLDLAEIAADGHFLAEEDAVLRPREMRKVRRLADEIFTGVRGRWQEIDAILAGAAEHWDVGRMLAIDRNVMRMAVFEIYWCTDIPPIVSINEAIDIAKIFGGDDSGAFVNGVLDRIYREHNAAPADG
jgi:N utilization substance protein B